MGFFSVPHKMGGCLSGKKNWEPQHFGKSWKDEVNLGQIEKLLKFQGGWSPDPSNFFLKLRKKTCLMIELSDKTILNSI